MLISVQYDETHVHKLLSSIVKHSNSDIVNLLSELICKDSKAVDYLFKLNIGDKLPDIIPKGTIVKIHKNGYWSSHADELSKHGLIDFENKTIAVIDSFDGHCQYLEYKVVINLPNNDKMFLHCKADCIEIIEEF